MKRGTKPTPLALRKLHGNPRQHTLPIDVPAGQGELWQPPEWMDEAQRLQWHYALDHAPPGLLTGTDRETLAIWVCASIEYVRAMLEVRRVGQIVKTKEGNAVQNPFLGIMNRQALIMLRAGSEMGFSPASRMALGRDPAEGATFAGSGRADELDSYLRDKPDRLDS